MKKINKKMAFKLFCENKPFTIVPCKMLPMPGHPFDMSSKIEADEIIEKMWIPPETTDPKEFAFERLIRSFAWYNCMPETGNHVSFYTE